MEVTVTHREPNLEKITGVDVFYTVKDWKVLAFQHKKRNKEGTFKFGDEEREQRDKIQLLCKACSTSKRFGDDDSFLKPLCASIYVIGDDETNLRHAVSAYTIEEYRKIYHRIDGNLLPGFLPKPSDLETVDRMFLQCTIGRRIQRQNDKVSTSLIQDAFLTGPDLLFIAELSR